MLERLPRIRLPDEVSATAFRGILASTVFISLCGLAIGLHYPLLTLILEEQGVSGTLIGASIMAEAVGAVVITPYMPALMRRVGLVSLLVVAVLVAAGGLGLLRLYPDPWFWMPVRLVIGAMGAISFYGAEYWIVAMAPAKYRGRVVAAYVIAIATCFGLGPLFLRAIGYQGWWPFLIAMFLLALSAMPLVLARRDAPRFTGEVSVTEVPRYFVANPTICVAVLLFGAIEAGLFGLLPAWGVRAGIGPDEAILLLAVAGFGNVAAQLILGPASDRYNRRLLLGLCAGACLASTLLLAQFFDVRLVTWALLFLWGGASAGLYSVALVELGARHEGRELAIGNAAVLLSYGLGAIAGPQLAGLAMDLVPPHGMLHALSGICALYLLLLVLRSLTRRGGG